MEINSGSTILHLYSEISSSQKKCLSVIKLDTTVIFLPAILGPEMAAPILWAPGFFWFFLQEGSPMPIKFLVLGGVGVFLEGGGGSANFTFMGVGID